MPEGLEGQVTLAGTGRPLRLPHPRQAPRRPVRLARCRAPRPASAKARVAGDSSGQRRPLLISPERPLDLLDRSKSSVDVPGRQADGPRTGRSHEPGRARRRPGRASAGTPRSTRRVRPTPWCCSSSDRRRRPSPGPGRGAVPRSPLVVLGPVGRPCRRTGPPREGFRSSTAEADRPSPAARGSSSGRSIAEPGLRVSRRRRPRPR